MTIWIGVDEAGYGPNLGPLVVCASMWKTTSSISPEDWRSLLFPAIRCASDAAPDPDTGIVIDDSKLVYQSGNGLASLERSALVLTQLCGGPTCDADAFRKWVDPFLCDAANAPRWQSETPLPLPKTDVTSLTSARMPSIQAKMRLAGIEVKITAARVLFPREFNRRLEQRDNKASVLSETSIELVRDLITKAAEQFADEELIVLCDKHGGRDRYFALLTHFFPEAPIKILREGEAESAYCWTSPQGKREIRFCARAERYPPTAAASIMAKYIRELCMAEWNAYWVEKIPGLVPTAGYPLDAKRYRSAISSLAKELGFEESDYWRRK